jgi:hypothetical protein
MLPHQLVTHERSTMMAKKGTVRGNDEKRYDIETHRDRFDSSMLYVRCGEFGVAAALGWGDGLLGRAFDR